MSWMKMESQEGFDLRKISLPIKPGIVRQCHFATQFSYLVHPYSVARSSE